MTIKQVLFTLITLFVFTLSATAQEVTEGKASYYGNKFHGRRTSSGERYHRDSLTCAHRTLPFGTKLKVRNKKNGHEVIVRVTDRGPFGPGRIVDLSLAAAKELDMLQAGVVAVEVTTIDDSTPAKADKDERRIPEFDLRHPDRTSGYAAFTLPGYSAYLHLDTLPASVAKRCAQLLTSAQRHPLWTDKNKRRPAKDGKAEDLRTEGDK